MNVLAFSALINLITSCILGTIVLIERPRSRINQLFAAFAASIAFWSYGYFFWQMSTDPASAFFWTRVLMSGAIFITPAYFYFVYSFLEIKISRLETYAPLVFIVFFLCATWGTDLFIATVRTISGFQFWPVAGPLLLPYLVLWGFFVIYPEISLLRGLFQSDYRARRGQLFSVLVGMTVGFIGGSTNYFLWFGIPVQPYGNFLVTVYVLFVAYAITRYQLFNMKVIATELLTFALWLLMFFRLSEAQTATDQIISVALLAASLIIGALLIRSVDKEVEQREQIEKLSEEKSEFMSFASHEIRNPITAMRGYASLILDGTTGETPQATKDAAQTILVTGNQVLMLIGQFLESSKLELGQVQYAKERFDIGTTVSVVVDGFVPNASQHKLSLTKHINFEGLIVEADETKFKEVVGNIIDNSIKYTPSGGITITVDKHNGMGRVTIEDTGVGIPKNVLPHLFRKFSRADAKNLNLRGTGLGLYLGKQFIEGMGGKIWAESGGEGTGSRFIIEVPAI
jgi:signal transduction histidine kinase